MPERFISTIKQLFCSRAPALFVLGLACLLLLYDGSLQRFLSPDPPWADTYCTSFAAQSIPGDARIQRMTGFRAGSNGLDLLPATRGEVVLSFAKKRHQGVLLRVWLYGDGGERRPNSITLACDHSAHSATVAAPGNYINAVFDLSPQVVGCSDVTITLAAENKTALTVKALDRVEVVIAQAGAARPQLPGFASVAGLVLAACGALLLAQHRRATPAKLLNRAGWIGLLVLAAYVRWQELASMAGTALYPDAHGYMHYAQQMNLCSASGFYSASFGAREPLFILLVKVFFELLGASATHLRLVSFFFSVVVVGLTYLIGRRWIRPAAGLCAGVVVALHPLLIDMSARGLREEWYTTLVLLFIYWVFLKGDARPGIRLLMTGLLAGAILLTRLEAAGMLFSLLLAAVCCDRKRWRVRAAAGALAMGALLAAPHLISTYKTYGDPLYALKRHAAFYRNLEFMGKPGFPSREQISRHGMYTGPEITPLEYFLKLHTPGELIIGSLSGFAKIHLDMTLGFAQGSGALQEVKHAAADLIKGVNLKGLGDVLALTTAIVLKSWPRYAAAALVTTSFLAGLVLLACSPYRLLYLFLVCFQLQTAFLASRGLDCRLTVHSYPLIALCCGYAVCWACGIMKRIVQGRYLARSLSRAV